MKLLLLLSLIQAPDSAHLKLTRTQTDSIRAETCRGGRLSASGLTCTSQGNVPAPRVTVLRRLANRVDSLERARLQQQPPPVVTPPIDTQPPPTGASNPVAWPGSVAEMPRVWLSYSYPTKTGVTINVPNGGDLQAALNSSRRGDEIDCSGTFTGNYVLPAKAGTGWIVLKGANCRLQTPNSAPALATAAAAGQWWLQGIEVTATGSAYVYDLVALGEGGYTQTTTASVPQDLVLERVYIHGQPSTQMSRCIALNSGRTAIVDSRITECHAKGFDAQAIGGWNGPGPYRITGNVLQGAGIGLLLGGGDPKVAGTVPSDIEIRRNWISKPVAWKGTGSGTVWTAKYLLEIKNAQRVLIESNVLEGSWGDAEPGEAVVFKSTNQDGGCRYCRAADVTFRLNHIKGVSAGFLIPGKDYHPSDSLTARIDISTNLIEIAAHEWSKKAFAFGGNARNIRLHKNVVTGAAGQHSFLYFPQYNGATGLTVDSLSATKGDWGMYGDGWAGGQGAWVNAVNAPKLWRAVTIIGSSGDTYPPGTVFSTQEPAWAATVRTVIQQATAGVVR